MIVTIRHRGLRRLYETGDTRGLQATQVPRIRRVLTALDSAAGPDDLNLMPGMRLHPLKGDYAGFWSVSVSGNWRLVFWFGDGDVHDVDLVDYH